MISTDKCSVTYNMQYDLENFLSYSILFFTLGKKKTQSLNALIRCLWKHAIFPDTHKQLYLVVNQVILSFLKPINLLNK